jgi:hypothetical protein
MAIMLYGAGSKYYLGQRLGQAQTASQFLKLFRLQTYSIIVQEARYMHACTVGKQEYMDQIMSKIE